MALRHYSVWLNAAMALSEKPIQTQAVEILVVSRADPLGRRSFFTTWHDGERRQSRICHAVVADHVARWEDDGFQVVMREAIRGRSRRRWSSAWQSLVAQTKADNKV